MSTPHNKSHCIHSLLQSSDVISQNLLGSVRYISCNSDECDGAKLATGGSSPRAPACVCWVTTPANVYSVSLPYCHYLIPAAKHPSLFLVPLTLQSLDTETCSSTAQVWDDRMISHVPKSKLLADCSTDVPTCL